MLLRIVLVFLIKIGNVIPTCTNFERYFKLVYECYCARLNFKFGIYRWQNMPLNILLIVFVTCNRLNGVLIQKNEGKKIKNLNDHFMLLMWQGINIDMKNSFSCGCQICKFQTNW